jgi:GH25 family lysozyme M1 (1,4-beta-N-acetylmuramidase)
MTESVPSLQAVGTSASVVLVALVAWSLGALPATVGSARLPATDDPALPHSLRTLRGLAGGQPARRAGTAGEPQGVDVASWQHPNGAAIDWGQVAAAGYRFAFVKATQGTYYVNRYFDADYAGARNAGLFRSPYHFADPSASDGRTQADYLLQAAPYATDGQSLPPAVDLEDVQGQPACYGLTPSAMVAWIASFSSEVQARTGRLPIVYSNASWWDSCTANSSAFAANPLWVASWGSSTPTMPAGWGSWSFWQYTSTGSVPGIPGGTDVSSFSGSGGGLSALAGFPPWGSLGGTLTSGPAAASWAPDRLDLFVRGTDGALWHKWSSNGQWSGYESLGGAIASGTGPAAVSWSPDRIDVLVQGTDGQLWHKWWSGGWSAWEPLGCALTSSPAVASWAWGRLDVLARGTDGSVWHLWYAGGWSRWEPLGGAGGSAPAATSWGAGRLDLFIAGAGGGLRHRWFDGGAWSGWEDLGGALSSAPAASSWGPGRIDLVALQAGGTPYHRSWASAWGPWSSVGGSGVADPAVVDPAYATIDAFVQGTDGRLWASALPV